MLATLIQAALTLTFGRSEPSPCPERSQYFDLAARMIESNVARSQLSPSEASSAFIEQVKISSALHVLPSLGNPNLNAI